MKKHKQLIKDDILYFELRGRLDSKYTEDRRMSWSNGDWNFSDDISDILYEELEYTLFDKLDTFYD